MATKRKALQAASGRQFGLQTAFTAIEDVFSTYLYTGNGSAQVIDNGIKLGQSFGSGSAKFDGSTSFLRIPAIEFGFGNFTVEGFFYRKDGSDGMVATGQSVPGDTTDNVQLIRFGMGQTNNISVYIQSAYAIESVDVPAIAPGNWFHFAVTRSGSTVRAFCNGVQVASGSSSSDAVFSAIGAFDYGPTPYQHFNGYVSDFRVTAGTALYTSSFTAPTGPLTAGASTSLLTCQGDDPFVDNSPNGFTITQNGDVQAVTFGPFDGDEAGEGGLVWLKSRSNGTSNYVYDTDRGLNRLITNTTNGGFSLTDGLSAFNSNGFSLGNDATAGQVNVSGRTYASWTFRKAPRFFDVVTWTGDGVVGRNISHSLNSSVGTIFVKRTDSSDFWFTYHRSIGAGNLLLLNETQASGASAAWNNTEPTSTGFTVSGNDTNRSGATYVAYLFAHDPLGPSGDGSDGLIDCGSFTTDSNGNVTVELGWEPQWILWKRTDGGAENWICVDTMRGWSMTSYEGLRPNISDAQFTNPTANALFPTANGFAAQAGASFSANATYIYIAIRRGPMRVPENGTEVFGVNRPVEADGQELRTQSGVLADMILHRPRLTQNVEPHMLSRLTGDGRFLRTSTTDAESSAGWWKFDNNEYAYIPYGGFFNNVGGLGIDAAVYSFNRAPNFFDVVAYTGDFVAGRTVPHNLGVAPEFMIIKKRNADRAWINYHSALTATSFVELNNASAAFSATTVWNDTEPDADNFTVGTNESVNGLNQTYIAYLFASLDGVSKVGSYTGNGSSQTINCGFTTGARFILIKRTDATGDWYVWDTARGIVSGDDPFLRLNSNAAEVTNDDSVDPESSGFIVNQTSTTNVNVNGGSYIFLAIS